MNPIDLIIKDNRNNLKSFIFKIKITFLKKTKKQKFNNQGAKQNYNIYLFIKIFFLYSSHNFKKNSILSKNKGFIRMRKRRVSSIATVRPKDINVAKEKRGKSQNWSFYILF